MQRASVTYVRHAMPVAERDADPREWHLDDDARRAAEELAERLEAVPQAIVSSTEPKALETAAAVGERWGVGTIADERLREVVRPWVGAGYRSVAHRYLRGEQPAGWEPHDDVADRAAAAVADAQEAAGGGPLVVVTHGLVLALHLGACLGREFDRESFWSCLAFPDAWCLDDAGMLHRPQGRTTV